ncbi:MarR family transcriptional regulator [Angustibacter sp. Root456]|uniref:MarR family transcriptional regulator n=1 Tax=Angustibacter sp. Root456 TaxID=1736539 RepID=UPI0009EB22A7|nr:MarR family transcriptional regulator [Angustibacter sp. Root456]
MSAHLAENTASPSTTDADLDARAVQATLAASRALMGVMARSMASVLDQITLPQFRVLVLLSTSGALRTGALAERSGVHASTLTRTADRLVRGGWVRRLENPLSRREVLIELTDAGAALVREVTERRAAEAAEILSRLSPEGREQVLAGFEAFATAAAEPTPQDLLVLGA